MAKRSGKFNKSQAIRDYATANPEAKAKEIAEALNSAHGVKIPPQYVSTILSVARKKKGKVAKRGRAAKTAGASFDADAIVKVAALVNSLGADKVKAAMSLLEKLKS